MRRAILALSLVALGAALSCSGKKVIVGVVLPMSGEQQAYGTSIRSGLKLAFDEAQQSRKPPTLEVIFRDSASSAQKAAQEAAELYGRGAVIVIGGATSPEGEAIIPVAEKNKAVVLSPSASDPDLAAASNLFFRVYPSDALEGATAADFIAARGAKNIILLTEDNAYTKGLLPVFLEELGKRGGTVAVRLTIGDGGWERKLADAIKEKKGDAIYVCGYGEAILASLLEIRNAAFPGLVVTTSAISTVDLVWRGGKLVEGIYFPMIQLDLTSSNEPMASFVKRYKDANNNLMPDNYAAHGYDAGLAAIEAIRKAVPQVTSARVLEGLMELEGLRGVTGPLSFDQFGNIKRTLRIHCVREGKVEDCDRAPAQP